MGNDKPIEGVSCTEEDIETSEQPAQKRPKGCGHAWHWVDGERRCEGCDAGSSEVERLREENRELAGQNYEFIGALLKLDADKNCTGNCKRGDGKVTALCWRHKLLQDTLGDELSYADLRTDGGLPEARTAEKGGA